MASHPEEIALENHKIMWLFGYHIAIWELKANLCRTSHLPSHREASILPNSLLLCLAYPVEFA
jgi:hypothetical protein